MCEGQKGREEGFASDFPKQGNFFSEEGEPVTTWPLSSANTLTSQQPK